MDQFVLPEDPNDVIIALNGDIKTAYKELIGLEDKRDVARGNLDTFNATRTEDGEGGYLWYESGRKMNAPELLDWLDRQREFKSAVSSSTRAVNKQRNKIIKQVGESIDASEGNRIFEPMRH